MINPDQTPDQLMNIDDPESPAPPGPGLVLRESALGSAPAPVPGVGQGSNRYGEVSWERMVNAVEKVRERLSRAVSALERADVPYALVGGNAVAAWVSRVDETAVRNTQDVDLLLRRADMDRAIVALAQAGFVHRHAASMDMFLDGPNARARDSVHVVFAREKVRPEYVEASPDVSDVEYSGGVRLLNLESLVRMKLTSYRDKDRTHLRDLIGVGLIDSSWLGRLPAELAARLQFILEHPED